MARLEQIAMRLEVKEGKNGCVLINDSYNSDLASLDIALDFMSRRSDDKGKNGHLSSRICLKQARAANCFIVR